MSATSAPIVASVEDRWPAEGLPAGATALDALVLASNLLGADRRVANFGGGNTSAKGTVTDHVGREVAVMWVKGSGSDLATMGPEHFTGLRMEELEPLIERPEMPDDQMVAHLAKCMVDPAMPRSSIETLLHAFIPAAHVHHTHPDGINVIAGTADGERIIAEIFGDEAAWIPYIRPGFTLSKQVGEAVRGNPGLKLVVLAKHGLVCWGDTAEEAYKSTIEVINKAVAWVNEKTAGTPRFGGSLAPEPLGDDARAAVLADVLPALRGAVSSERHKLLTVDTSPAAVELVASRDAERLVTIGAACPDHLVHTKRVPLWIPYDPATDDAPALIARIRERAEAYRVDYRAYVERFGDETTVPGDPDARVVLIQHVGLVAVGTTTKASGLSRDLYHRAIEVMAGAEALGEFVSLSDEESFAVEYWPLELYKLSLAPRPGELQGQVAFVTGAAGGIGAAIAQRLAAAGAVVVGFDLDGAG
ncbi:MAG: rhamnulose-phosphate aldolase/alcohol dehydrogenase, partial [Conexibacter sp.]|nr:rhamnulose-phosphate aldolase/alcohol dehydrogenase [Conexibacter sp.]